MNQIEGSKFLKSVMPVLRETFESSGDRPFSIYLDGKIGVFETLDKLSAEQASQDVNGNTIASHAEHARFYLDALEVYMNGSDEHADWNESWRIKAVNDEEWNVLKQSIRETYEKTKSYLKSTEEWDERKIGGAIAIIAHTAYHFGAIRQMLKAV